MRLPDFILENLEPILQAWEDFARTIETPGADLDSEALRDHAEEMLRAIVVTCEQSRRSESKPPSLKATPLCMMKKQQPKFMQ